MIRKLEGVLDDMCSIIEYYERKARLKNATANVRSLMTNLGIDVDKAMELLNIEDKYRTIIVDNLKVIKHRKYL